MTVNMERVKMLLQQYASMAMFFYIIQPQLRVESGNLSVKNRNE